MGKYTELHKSVYSVFGTTEWKAENIKTFPSNYVSKVAGNEYIRVHILAGGSQIAGYPRSVSGQIIIDIFTNAGIGTLRTDQIADRLDTYLVGKTIDKVQFGTSNLTNLGIDSADTSLFRSNYVISFNYYGVE
jgi:hypothetical protein